MQKDRESGIFTLVGKPEDSEMKASIEKLKRAMEEMMEFHDLSATLKKSQFDAYIKAGFSKEEALKLIQESS